MSTIRVRSPASYWLALPAAAWMLGVVVVPIVLLVWVYYSAQIFLIGAEFTWVYAGNFGSRRPVAQGSSESPMRATMVPARPDR